MDRNDIWSPRSIYLYLVCLVTLIMVIFAAVNLVRSTADLLYPQPQMGIRIPAPTEETDLDPAQAEEFQRAQEINQRRWNTRNAVLSMIGSVTLLAIAGPLYLYHWLKIERERRAARAL